MTKKKNSKKMNALMAHNGSFAKHNQHLNGNAESELSDRELQILQFFAYGFTTPELSREIFISEHTIESHRKSIIKKMKVRNLTHAIAEAMRKKIIQ